MNKFFFCLFFLLIFLPALAEDESSSNLDTKKEDISEEVLDDNILDDTEEEKVNYFRVRNAAQVSPKKVHNVSLYKAYKSLEKEKLKLEKLKNRELWLLKDEAEVLDYTFK